MFVWFWWWYRRTEAVNRSLFPFVCCFLFCSLFFVPRIAYVCFACLLCALPGKPSGNMGSHRAPRAPRQGWRQSIVRESQVEFTNFDVRGVATQRQTTQCPGRRTHAGELN